MKYCFLLSSERSGSNMITRLLDGHSKICGPSPTHLLRTVLEHRSLYGELGDAANWRLLVDDIVSLQQSKLGTWRTSVSAQELLANTSVGNLSELLRYPFEKEARSLGKSQLFIKENHFYRHFAAVESLFGDATFVFLVRDPRDMALSWKRSGSLRGCVIRAAETWKADQVGNLALYHALSDSGRVVGVRYEDLVTGPGPHLERICSMLGVGFEPEMVHLDRHGGDRRSAEATVEWANLDRPLIADNFEKYRDGLSAEEIQFVEALCANEMRAVGYRFENPETASLVSLRAAIQPLELYEKPQYAQLDERARARQSARAAVLRDIERRPAHALWTT